MKKSQIALVIFFLLNAFIACKKDENTPVVTILGKNPDSVIVKTTTGYVDAGATATDIEDGDLTSKIVTATNVNMETVSSYRIYYSVEDAAHNVSEKNTRIVEVIKPDAKYSATFSCPGNTSDTITVTSHTAYTALTIANIFVAGAVVEAQLNNNKYDIVAQTIAPGVELSGTLTPSGTSLIGDFTVGASTCTATFVRR